MSGQYNCKGKKYSLGWYLFQNVANVTVNEFYNSMPIINLSVVTDKVTYLLILALERNQRNKLVSFKLLTVKPLVQSPLNDNNFVKFMRGTGQGVQIFIYIFYKKMSENIYVIKMMIKCEINLVR